MCTLAYSLRLDSWSNLVRPPRGSGWYERPRIWRYCKCPVRVANGRMLAVYDNDCICCILHARHRDYLSMVELRRSLRLASIPTQLVQRRLCWFGHAARRPEDELIRSLRLPKPLRSWRKWAGGQLNKRATTVKENREPLSGLRVIGCARLGENFKRTRAGHSSLGCLYPRCGQLHWWCRLTQPPYKENLLIARYLR